MGKQFNLSEAAKEILEGAKETQAANVAGKRSGQDGTKALQPSVAYGTKSAGVVGVSPTDNDDQLPDYLKGTPKATPPGATPPVGAQKDGVGATKAKGPADSEGSENSVDQKDAVPYEGLRDRKKYSAPAQTFKVNPGSKGVESYGEGVDMSDDVAALLEGENLSEDFKTKATTIFEAAVNSRIQQIAEQIEESMQEQFQAEIEAVKEDLATKVDDYLSYMVQEWATENKLAIEKGLRAEVVEDFIHGLRNLFIEHYIDIPEDKVDVVEQLTTKVEELEMSLNEQINRAVELTKELNEQKKIEAIYAVCEGLTQTQVEKMKALAESVEYTTDEEFAAKLSTLKESYFKAEVVVADASALNDEIQIEEETKPKKAAGDDLMMEEYAKTISKTLSK